MTEPCLYAKTQEASNNISECENLPRSTPSAVYQTQQRN